MLLEISENSDLLYILINEETLIFYKNSLNFIFSNQDKIFNLSIIDTEPNEFNNLIENSDWFLIVSQGFQGKYCLDILIQKYNFRYLNFLEFGYFWYARIKGSKLYEEHILENIDSKLEIYDIPECQLEETYYNTKDLVIDLRKNIKDSSLKQLAQNEVIIYKNFRELQKIIQKTKDDFNQIYKTLTKKITHLQQLEDNKKNKIDLPTNNTIYDTNLKNKNLHLLKLEDLIEEQELKKINVIQQLNTVNKKILEGKNSVNSLQDNVRNLQEEKNRIYQENLKLQQRQSLIVSKPIIESKPLIRNTRKIAIMVHIFSVDIYEEIISYLRNLLLHSQFDLYINLAINDRNDLQKTNLANFINKVRNQTLVDNCYFTISDNKGLDIGGFLTSYLKMLELNLNYDSIIKIHTKTNDNWRFAMLYALLGNSKIVQHNLKLIEKDNVGIIGNQTLLIRNSSNRGLVPLLNHYMRKFKIIGELKGSFIPGTIFWIKGSVLKRYFTNKLLKGCYDEFKQNYCGYTNRKIEGLPHAFERLFGIMVSSLNKEVVKFDS
jgi:hypothetical protein